MSLSNWAEEARLRIKSLKRSHYLQRIQLELNFETTPRDSRYSNGLLELMKKEEAHMKDPNSATAKNIMARVDESLRNETQMYFAKSVQQNNKRWQTLKEKFAKERNQLKNELSLRGEIPPLSRKASSSTKSEKRIPTSEELDQEAFRLECDYNKNWYKYEMYNLQQAFKSQTARVENDWLNHEIAVEDEYRQKKDKILGTSSPNPLASPQNHDQRWQHPEKQKTLIHTAPVLSPTRGSEQSGFESPGKWARSSKELELERVEKEYSTAMESLERQKAEAKRWLMRQQIRLMAQAEEVQKEKAAVGELLEGEYEDYVALMQFVDSLAAQNSQNNNEHS